MFTDKLIDKLKLEKTKFVPARSASLPRARAEDILETIKKNLTLDTREEAVAVIALLFQQGGTARGCDGNMSVTIFDQSVKLIDIRKVLKQHSCSKAERKLARTLASEIQQISLLMEIPGNLYAKIQKKYLEKTFSIDEKAWMSDFQSDNPDCPNEIKTLIHETFKSPSKETLSRKKNN